MDDFSSDIHTTGFLSVFGDSVSAVNETIQDWDFFRVELDPFTEYSFVIIDDPPGSRPDKQVFFYDEHGDFHSRSYERDDDHYFRTHGGGRFFIGVQGQPASYTIRLIELDSGGNDFASATPGDLRGNRYLRSSIFESGDVDWFTLELKSGTTYEFHALGTDTDHGSLANPALRAWDSDGNWLASDDNSGTGNNARFTITTGEAGLYYFEVFSAAPNGTGSYHIFSDQLDDFDAALSKPGQLELNSTGIDGMIDYTGDRDWFEISLVKGNRYDILADSGTLRVYNPSGTVLSTSNYTSTIGRFFNYLDTALYVEVTGAAFSSYNIQVNDIDDFPESSETISWVIFNSAARFGQLEAGDRDWHRVELFNGGLYEFNVVATEQYDRVFEGEMLLKLYDMNGSLVASSTEPELQFRASLTGSHYISVEGADASANGHYKVDGDYIDSPIPEFVFENDVLVVAGALDYRRDLDQTDIEMTAGTPYLIYRTSFPYDRTESEVFHLRQPDGTTREFRSRSSYSDRFNLIRFTAPETGTYTIIENDDNDAGPAGYRYEIDQNYAAPALVHSEPLFAIDGDQLVSDRFFDSFTGEAFEIHSGVDLVHSGSITVPAKTQVVLTPEEFETLTLPDPLSQSRVEISLRARQAGGKWAAWSRMSTYDAVVPEVLIPDPDAVPRHGFYQEPLIRFSFAQSLPDYYEPGDIVNFQPLSAFEEGRVHRAHGRWNSSAVKVIRELDDINHHAEIVVFKADITEDVIVFAPGPDKGHDIVINANSPVMQDLSYGSEGFYKMLRAVGQAIGFQEHPGLDGQKTIMGTHDPGLPFPQTPLQWDVSALLLAHDESFFYPGISVTKLRNDRPAFDLWTGNTLDASEATNNVHIDLRPGAISYVEDPTETYALATPANVFSGNIIIGSMFDDWASGSHGRDDIQAGDGNDRLFGRQGVDTLNGGLGHDVYVFFPGDQQDTIEGDQGGFDTLRINGLDQMTSLADDLTFERLGDDMLVRLEWDSLNYPNSDQILLRNFASESHRIESLLWTNPAGATERISLVSVFSQLNEYRQRFEPTGSTDAFGMTVSPV